MNVKPGEYHLSTLLMMAGDISREAALALIAAGGFTVNGWDPTAFEDPRIPCWNGTVDLSNEGTFVITSSGYYAPGGGGVPARVELPDEREFVFDILDE